MTTTAVPNTHDTTPTPALFIACELSENTWKLGLSVDHIHQQRERTLAARVPNRLIARGVANLASPQGTDVS